MKGLVQRPVPDPRGAYGRVPRCVLWEALQRLGVHGLLVALQALYTHARDVNHVSRTRGVATSPAAAPSRAAR